MLAFVEATQLWCAQAGVPCPTPSGRRAPPEFVDAAAAGQQPSGTVAATDADDSATPTPSASPLMAPQTTLTALQVPVEVSQARHGSPGGRSAQSDGTASFCGWEDDEVDRELDE